MTPHQHWFTSYSPHVVPIRLADHTIIYSAGIGSVEFQPMIGGIPNTPVVFHEVLHVPKLASNLLSILYLTRLKGYRVVIENDQLEFFNSNDLHFTATVNDHNVGYLNGHVLIPQSANAASTCPLDLTLWHRRCSHLNFADLKHMHLHKSVLGMSLDSQSPPDPICEPCILGKQHRHNIPKTASRKSSLLALVHTDLKGPLPVQTQQGYQYWQPFVDDKSRFITLAFLKCKSEAFDAFKQYKAFAEKKLGKQIQMSRDDKGGEFISKEFNQFCADNGILRQHTEPNEPHQNGVAEKANQDIAHGTTALLVQAKLPPSFWAHAAATYVHTRNRTPTSALNGDTPYFHWKGKKPDISYFRVFGCLAYVLIPKEKRKALQPHSKKCIFIGYPDGVKAWKFWDPVEKKVIISSHAVFDERCFPGNSTTIIDLVSLPPTPSTPSTSTPEVVFHQGGDENNHDEAPSPVLAANDPIPPVDPIPDIALDPTPASAPSSAPASPPSAPRPNLPSSSQPIVEPKHCNPPHASCPQTSLNENILSHKNSPPPASIHTPSPSPDPLLMSPPPLHPPQPLSPVPESNTDDELLLRDNEDDDELEYLDQVRMAMESLFNDHTVDHLTFDQAVEYAFTSSQHAFKSATHWNEPNSYQEAMQRSEEERDHWHKAALDEIQSLIENGTFELVQLPPNRKAIGSRWVFKVKRKADGSIERHKARLVAKGYAQHPGFDFTETFAPTPKWASLRAILALAAFHDLHLESVDISSAFLNGELEEEVYMQQPEGFIEKGKDWYWLLKKSLYGLKQAPRCWHKKLNQALEEMGFNRIICEHSIWIYHRDDTRIIIPVFVDDMTIVSKSQAAIQKVKDELQSHFKLRDLGPTTWLLGVEITRNWEQHSISLSQHQYVLDLLERFKLSDCNTVSTPLDPSVKLSLSMCPQSSSDIEEMKSIPYLQAVGSLMYLAIATRPDIAYAVGVLARFNQNPSMQHWKAVKHVFRYLKGTLDYKLTYSPDPTSTELFTTFSDADHAGNPDNGRSTSGYVVKMGTGAISWSSKLQGIVALSTTEAEYVAATTASQEILWLRNLFHELGYSLSSPSTLFIDNQSALAVAKNPEHHGRMKHLDPRFYWLRNEVEKGTITPIHVRTDAMVADIMTKALGRVKVIDMIPKLGLTK